MNKILLIYATYPSIEKAQTTIEKLIINKLIVCANVLNAKSFYWWQEQINEDKEIVIIFKSLEEKYQEIVKIIEENHPYEIPCILKFGSFEVNEKFYHYTLERLDLS